MNLWYMDEVGRKISLNVADMDALYTVAHRLVNAPINLDYLYSDAGVFNLHTFEWNF